MKHWMIAVVGGFVGLNAGQSFGDADYTLSIKPGWYGASDGSSYVWENVPNPVWATDMEGCWDNESGCTLCPDSSTRRIWGNAPYAHAAPGSLAWNVDIHSGCYNCCGVGGESNAYARFALDDVIFSSPDSGSITVSMNLVVNADHMQGTFTGGSVFIDAPGGSYYCHAGGTNIPGYVPATPVQFTTGTFTVPLNTPWNLSMVLSGHAGVSPKGGASMAQTQAELSFPSSLGPEGPMPVFNVPAGVTVNSEQGGIVDNTWTPPAPPCEGDLDHNGAVDTTDLLALLAGWGGPDGDLNNDNTTDVADLLILLSAWGEC